MEYWLGPQRTQAKENMEASTRFLAESVVLQNGEGAENAWAPYNGEASSMLYPTGQDSRVVPWNVTFPAEGATTCDVASKDRGSM
jgi:hypothetical protein